MSTKATNFVPQSEASKKASSAALRRFAFGAMTELYKEQQAETAKKAGDK